MKTPSPTPSFSKNPSNRFVVIATHSGCHHADDAFGVAVIQLLFPFNQVIRTRNPEDIDKADFAVDVGGVWDPETNRFDHHQKGFAGARPNGVVYASAGLVWAKFGRACVMPFASGLSNDEIDEIVESIDVELVQHLDRADTGAAAGAPGLFGLSALVSQFNSTWIEEKGLTAPGREALRLSQFEKAAAMVRVLERIIADKVAEAAATTLVREAPRLHEGRILVLTDSGLPWMKVVCAERPDCLFVVYPDSSHEQYQVRVVTVEPESFVARKDMPSAWAGLRDSELAVVSGVPDAVFCHNNLFICGAHSLEGAIRLAELSLQHPAT